MLIVLLMATYQSRQLWPKSFFLMFGVWQDFFDRFKASFIQENIKDQAIAWLTTTKVNNSLPLPEHIFQFKNNTALSEIKNEDAPINFFSRGILTSIMRRIFSMDTVPDTVEKWYTQALHFKLVWERADNIAKGQGNPFSLYQGNKNHTYQRPVQKPKHPNTMDVDAICLE